MRDNAVAIRSRRRRAAAFGLAVFALAAVAVAAPTDLDQSFGTGGLTRLTAQPLSGLAKMPTGFAIIAGNRLQRITADGRVDASVVAQAPSPPGEFTAVAAGPDGTTFALHTNADRWPIIEGFLSRYRPDGASDTGFGVGGSLRIGSFLRAAVGGSLVVDAGDNAVFGAGGLSLTVVDQSVLRVDSAGRRRSLVDVSGYVTDVRMIGQLTAAEDGSLYAVRSHAGGPAHELALSRILPTGGWDPAFGSNGIAIAPTAAPASATSVAVSAGGALYMAGTMERSGTPQVVVARFTAGGDLDRSFGDGGVAFVDAAPGEPMVAPRVLVQSDGRLLVVGTALRHGHSARIVLARLNVDGSPDDRFAPSGVASFWWGRGTELQDIAVLADGRIVVAGNVWTSTPTGSAVTREGVVFRLQGGVDAVARPLRERGAVEYHHAGYGHYFLSADPDEIAILDTSPGSGWARTGKSFRVWDDTDASLVPVCRFWSNQTWAPKSSHFYTPYADECTKVKADPAWHFERNAFVVQMPQGTPGARTCGAGSVPLYRAYNAGKSGAPNHRYTNEAAVLDAMLAQGWIMEGEATTRVFACVPVP